MRLRDASSVTLQSRIGIRVWSPRRHMPAACTEVAPGVWCVVWTVAPCLVAHYSVMYSHSVSVCNYYAMHAAKQAQSSRPRAAMMNHERSRNVKCVSVSVCEHRENTEIMIDIIFMMMMVHC